jgi:hypothetical protein
VGRREHKGKMTHPDRAIERLLREGAARPSEDGSAHCLDADTLAAWVDGRLSRVELTAAEAHAAACARCQAMLAVMARTAESSEHAATVAVAPRRSVWRMLPWMGPLAAAATAAAIYVAVRPNVDIVNQPAHEKTAQQAASAEAKEQEARQTAAPLEPAVQGFAVAPSVPSTRADEKDQADRERQLSANERRDLRSGDADKRSAAKSTAPTSNATQPPAEQRRKPAPVGELSGVAPQTPPAASDRPVASPPPARPLPPASPPPPAVVAEEAKRREAFSATGAAVSPAGARADAFLDRAAVPLVIQSPDLDIQWRVVAGNVVQRTTDRGRTWVTQATGTTKAIAAGFSPSATVCWVVGAGGVVAVTADGKTWTSVAFPEPIDLTNVQATSADAVVVFAADGRTFTTIDRGKSWK